MDHISPRHVQSTTRPWSNHKDAWEFFGKQHPMDMGVVSARHVLEAARVVKQPGGDHCFFHALSFGLEVFGDKVQALDLRMELAAFAQDNSTVLVP